MGREARHWQLNTRPKGEVTEDTLRLKTVGLRPLSPGEVLVKTIYLSIDPATRLYISEKKTYWRQIGIGEVVPTLGIGSVVESASEKFKAGDLVRGMMACGDFVIVRDKELLVVPPNVKRLPVMLGTLGHTGLTAYVGLVNVGHITPRDTVLVSGAAGATGSSVVQIAKALGCYVIGLVGTEAKKDWVTRMLGADACINYTQTSDLAQEIARIRPNGIDLYWDIVGERTLDAALTVLKPGGRVVLCGTIGSYNRPEELPAYNMHLAISKGISLRGFIVLNYVKQYPAAIKALLGWTNKGKLVSKETILQGLEEIPVGLRMVLNGGNIGKTIIQVSEDPRVSPKL